MTNEEAYNKGYKDGQEAIAFHYELCKDERSIITVPKKATNGEVIKAVFPNIKVKVDPQSPCITETNLDGRTSFNTDWWNSPYRKE